MEEPTPGQQDQIDKITRYWTHAKELDGQAAEYRYMAAETITEMVDGGAGVREVARWLGKNDKHIRKALRAFKMCVENDWPPTRFQEAYAHAREPQTADPGPQNEEPDNPDPEDDDELHSRRPPGNNDDDQEGEDPWLYLVMMLRRVLDEQRTPRTPEIQREMLKLIKRAAEVLGRKVV